MELKLILCSMIGYGLDSSVSNWTTYRREKSVGPPGNLTAISWLSILSPDHGSDCAISAP